MNISEYGRIIRRRGWIVILAVILTSASAYIFSKMQTPLYRSTQKILIQPARNDFGLTQTLVDLLNSYQSWMSTYDLAQQVINALKLDMTPDQLVGPAKVTVDRNNNILQVDVDLANGEVANRIAAEYTALFIQWRTQQNQPLQLADRISAVALDPPRYRADPPNHRPKCGGRRAPRPDPRQCNCVHYRDAWRKCCAPHRRCRADFAAARPQCDPGNRQQEHSGMTAAPIIQHASTTVPPLVTLADPQSAAAEAYRTLRTNILFSAVDQPIHALTVTSTQADDGKSTLLANLAVTLAQSGHTTLLVDADLRRPAQHMIWKLTNDRGLSSMLLDTVQDATSAPAIPVQPTGVDKLSVLTSGPLPPNPADLLLSDAMTAVLATLRGHAEYVLFDAPPVLAVTDAAVLASKMDGLLLVIKAGATRRDQAERARDALQRVHVRIIGVALTNAPREANSGKY